MTYFGTEVSHVIRRYFSIYFNPDNKKTKSEVQDDFILYLKRFWINVRPDVSFNGLPNRILARPDIVIINSATNENVAINFKWVRTNKPVADLWNVIYKNSLILNTQEQVETIYTILIIQKDVVSSKPNMGDKDRLLYNVMLNRLVTLQKISVKNNQQVNMSVMWLNSANNKYQFCILTQDKQAHNK